MYCYDETGICPFWELRNDKPKQQNGYCHFLNEGDWESEGTSLLWDQCKECQINQLEEDEEEDIMFEGQDQFDKTSKPSKFDTMSGEIVDDEKSTIVGMIFGKQICKFNYKKDELDGQITIEVEDIVKENRIDFLRESIIVINKCWERAEYKFSLGVLDLL